MALFRDLLVPVQGLGLVRRRALAPVVHHAAVELCVGLALFRDLFKPVQGLGLVHCRTLAFHVHPAAAQLSPGVTLSGGFLIPVESPGLVRRRAIAVIIHDAAVELGLGVSLFRGLFVPVQGPGLVRCRAQALVVHHAAVELCVGVSLFRGLRKKGKCLCVILGHIGAHSRLENHLRLRIRDFGLWGSFRRRLRLGHRILRRGRGHGLRGRFWFGLGLWRGVLGQIILKPEQIRQHLRRFLIALFGGHLEVRPGLVPVPGCAVARVIHHAAEELSVNVALFRGCFIPVQGLGFVCRCALASVVHPAALELGFGVTQFSGFFAQGQTFCGISGLLCRRSLPEIPLCLLVWGFGLWVSFRRRLGLGRRLLRRGRGLRGRFRFGLGLFRRGLGFRSRFRRGLGRSVLGQIIPDAILRRQQLGRVPHMRFGGGGQIFFRHTFVVFFPQPVEANVIARLRLSFVCQPVQGQKCLFEIAAFKLCPALCHSFLRRLFLSEQSHRVYLPITRFPSVKPYLRYDPSILVFILLYERQKDNILNVS